MFHIMGDYIVHISWWQIVGCIGIFFWFINTMFSTYGKAHRFKYKISNKLRLLRGGTLIIAVTYFIEPSYDIHSLWDILDSIHLTCFFIVYYLQFSEELKLIGDYYLAGNKEKCENVNTYIQKKGKEIKHITVGVILIIFLSEIFF